MTTNFLEFAVHTDNVLESISFYRGLGFTELAVNDATTYPYGVVSDGNIAIGLHSLPEFESTIRFVRPDVQHSVLALTETGTHFVEMHLDEDELHRVSLSGPFGNKVTWVEARTFSPPAENIAESGLGRFLELTLPVGELYEAARFWAPYAERVIGEQNDPPHMRLDASGLALGLCETNRLKGPQLTFVVRDLDRLQTRMDQMGIMPSRNLAPPNAFAALQAPEGTPIVLYREDFMNDV